MKRVRFILKKRETVFFKTIAGKSEYNVEETQITYQPEKGNEYIEIKKSGEAF